MIKLNDKYSIGFDTLNYTLVEKKKINSWKWKNKENHDEGKIYGKSHGQETEEIIGYYGRLKELIMGILDHKVKTTGGKIESLEMLDGYIVGYAEDMANRFKTELDELRSENLSLRLKVEGRK